MNRRARWLTFTVVAAGVALAVVVGVLPTGYVAFNQWRPVVRDSTYRALLRDFNQASPVRQRPIDSDSTGWDFDVSLPSGVRVSVRARSHMDAVRVKYSDETEEREVYRYRDYSNPVSLRTKAHVLYVYWGETLFGTTHWVVGYDLVDRRQLARKRVVEGDIRFTND
jgi:hypothetical protein